LTILYGAAFFAAGALLLAVNYAFVRYNLQQQTPTLVLPEGVRIPDEVISEITERASDYQRTLQQKTLDSLLRQSLIALIGVGAAALLLGYLVTERALAPLQDITAATRRVAGGKLTERIGLNGPDDEIKELADTFDVMVARLQQSFEAQQRFVAHASHELRTPLALNRTVLEVALADPGASGDLRKLASELLEVNERNERLIEGLLILARSEHDLPERETVDLTAVCEHAVDDVSDESSRVGVRLRVQLEPLAVSGSALLLTQLVTNLLHNAVRYNVPHGVVDLSVVREGAQALLIVSNTGPVVPQEEIPRLFEPFQSLSGARIRGAGTGLGLSIVRAIATTHGGGVTAQGHDGGGLTVVVSLPALGDIE
jgi:signal transduction histidine kinase